MPQRGSGWGHFECVRLSDNLPNDTAKEPDERLLELIVALSGDVIILQVLLAVECDLLSLDLAIFDINLVANEDNGDVLTDANQILVPFWHILVSDARADVEHDDAAVSTNASCVRYNVSY